MPDALKYTQGVAEDDDPTCRIGDVVASWEHGYGTAGRVCGIDPMIRSIEVIWDDGRAKLVERVWKHVDKVVFQYRADSTDEPLECLDAYKGACTGAVELRTPLTDTGKSFPRCEGHWSERLDKQQEINERYPVNAPRDFDPMYAGERWNEDD